MTHNNIGVIGASAFIARCVYKLTHAKQPLSVIIPLVVNELKEKYPKAIGLVLIGIKSVDQDSESFAQNLMPGKVSQTTTIYPGKTCGVDGALPLIVQIVMKHEKDCLINALIANVLIGGDTAARGMIIGMLLSRNGIPKALIEQVKAYKEIEGMINRFMPAK